MSDTKYTKVLPKDIGEYTLQFQSPKEICRTQIKTTNQKLLGIHENTLRNHIIQTYEPNDIAYAINELYLNILFSQMDHKFLTNEITTFIHQDIEDRNNNTDLLNNKTTIDLNKFSQQELGQILANYIVENNGDDGIREYMIMNYLENNTITAHTYYLTIKYLTRRQLCALIDEL